MGGGLRRTLMSLLTPQADRQSGDSLVEAPRRGQTPAPETESMMGALKRRIRAPVAEEGLLLLFLRKGEIS